MSRILEYMVLEAPTAPMHFDPPLVQLQNMVRRKLEEGWEPIGGIATGTRLEEDRPITTYLQAIVKRDDARAGRNPFD